MERLGFELNGPCTTRSSLLEMLHTFGKGIVEDTIGVILMIIQITAKIDSKYEGNLELLDQRMSTAPYSNSLEVRDA